MIFWKKVAGVFLILFVLGGAIAPVQIHGGEGPFEEIANIGYAGTGEDVVLRIGDALVPSAVLAEFLGRYVTKNTEDFLERELAVYDVLTRGRSDGWPKDLRSQVRLLYLYGLGQDYYNNGSRDVVRVSADEIKSSLPGRLVRGKFELLLFGSESDAREVLKSIRTAEEFEEYGRKYPEKRKSLAEISPDSGFFHPFDDATLFNRMDGEVAGYMETGVGSALVLVRSVRKMSEEEVAREIDTIRNRIFENKRLEYFRQVRIKYPVSIDREAIEDFSGRELRKGITPGMDREFCNVGGIPINFSDFNAIYDTPLSRNLREGQTDMLAQLYRNACETVGQNVSYGFTAIENDHVEVGDSWGKWFEERKRRVYYLRGILDFLGDEWAATDKDARKYYKEHRSTKYDVPESVRALYIFVSDEARAREVLDRIGKGDDFERIAEQYSEFEGHGHTKGARVVRINRGSDIHKSIQDAVFNSKMKKGSVTGAIRTPVGFHVFKIVEKAEARVTPFKKVADQIKNALSIDRFENGRKRYVQELRKKYSVVKFDDALKDVESRARGGAEGKPQPETDKKQEKQEKGHNSSRKAGMH